MENVLNKLVDELKASYADELVACFLYGSAASGDFHERFSDLNILCVLTRLSIQILKKAEKTVTWFVRKGNPPPLFLTQEELQEGHDVFPIEFLDMQMNHRLLFGRDVLEDLQISRKNHRLELEHELRTKFLGLRQTFLTVHQDVKALEDLMFRSLSAFITHMRHTLLLTGQPAPLQKSEIIQAFCARSNVDEGLFLDLLKIRKRGGGIPASQVESMFQRYFEEIGKLIKLVDQLPED
jgi:hypothetical protein